MIDAAGASTRLRIARRFAKQCFKDGAGFDHSYSASDMALFTVSGGVEPIIIARKGEIFVASAPPAMLCFRHRLGG